jgi:hypothetical protein
MVVDTQLRSNETRGSLTKEPPNGRLFSVNALLPAYFALVVGGGAYGGLITSFDRTSYQV